VVSRGLRLAVGVLFRSLVLNNVSRVCVVSRLLSQCDLESGDELSTFDPMGADDDDGLLLDSTSISQVSHS
jgi:hypothetical protein